MHALSGTVISADPTFQARNSATTGWGLDVSGPRTAGSFEIAGLVKDNP
jgi:hypothetical protein